MASTVPFSRVGKGHLISISVAINESRQARFMLDTGIGINIFFKAFCEEIKCNPTGQSFSGKRMSGQQVSCELVRVPSVSLPSFNRKGVIGGLLTMDLPSELTEIEGILSLSFFEDSCFTLDYGSRNLILEDSTSFSERMESGSEIPIIVRKEGPSVDAFLQLRLPNGRSIRAEIDTGSNDLILNEKFMEELGIEKDGAEKIEGKDETGNSFTRYFSKVHGSISLSDSEEFTQNEPEVIFQKIIYDGLIGVAFLSRYLICFDVKGSRMIFSKH